MGPLLYKSSASWYGLYNKRRRATAPSFKRELHDRVLKWFPDRFSDNHCSTVCARLGKEVCNIVTEWSRLCVCCLTAYQILYSRLLMGLVLIVRSLYCLLIICCLSAPCIPDCRKGLRSGLYGFQICQEI